MPDLAVFAFLLALLMVDHAMRRTTETRLIRIEARLRWLIWSLAVTLALGLAAVAAIEAGL